MDSWRDEPSSAYTTSDPQAAASPDAAGTPAISA
jgi:hypothetical protein